jgi:hypothetical protein
MTGIRAFAAGFDASFHATQFGAGFGAFFANRRAFGADMAVMFGVHQYEMRRRTADFSAFDHQPEMPGFGVIAAFFKAMIHGGGKTGLIAVQALLNAALHVLRNVMHGYLRTRLDIHELSAK